MKIQYLVKRFHGIIINVVEITRTKELKALKEKIKESPVVAILGPRQCGKTTLAQQFKKENSNQKIHFFDLEDPQDLASLENPSLTFDELRGLIVIDEIQRRPELFPTIRVFVDRKKDTKYLILGSASRDLISQSSESLAGRISYLEMGGFTTEIIKKEDYKKLWLRGGFPLSFLAKNNKSSFNWRRDFITTFLERDIPNLGIDIPARSLRRFWGMLAHYHGQIFNASEIGQSLGIADTTARRYLDILSGTFVVRQLQPYFYNTKKRIIKRPKIYFRDTGILHTLLSIEEQSNLLLHPKLGASWEGFATEQVISHLNLKEEEVFFWGVHTGAEIDLVFEKKGKLWGIEVKYNEAPALTKSIVSAMNELSLSHVWVIYPGSENYRLDKKVSVISLQCLQDISLKL